MRQDPALPGHAGPNPFAVAAAIAAAVASAVLAGWLALRPAAVPVPDVPDASRFSAGRALAHVQVLAQAPRPAGSAANARARDYLVRQIRALGLEPEIQTAMAQTASADMMANVRITLAEARNVVVRKPGAARTLHGGQRQAVLASARYDSDTGSPGAADGAAGAAALLEALRVLQAGPPLDNDIVFVFTDADADGLALGTRAFAEGHPWAGRARVALRFDHAGNRGPLALVDAGGADGFALGAWARLAPAPRGSSFMAALLHRLPQRAAARTLASTGAATLQFATIDGTLGRDGMHDVPQQLSSASLQHEGDTMLGLLRHFGNARLPAPGSRGQVFFALPLAGQVHYPVWCVWPLALLACALNAVACRTAVRRLGIAGSDIVHGLFGFLFMTALAIFLTWLCRETFDGLEWRWDAIQLAGDDGPRWQAWAFVLLPAALFVVLQRRLHARLGAACTALGAMLAAGIALLAVSVAAPGASYVLAWPLLAAQAAWLALASTRAAAWAPAWRAALPALAFVLALALIVPAAVDAAAWLSPRWLLLPALLACLLAALGGTLLAQAKLRFVAAPLLLAGGACVGMAYAAHPARPELPVPNRLLYLKDTPSWQAFWIHPAGPVDAWTRSVFPNALRPYVMPYTFGADSAPVWYGAARRDDAIRYPYLLIEKDERRGDVRRIAFLLRSDNGAPELVLRLQGADTLRSSVNGRMLTDRRYRGWQATLHGMGRRELRFAIELVGDPAFSIFVQEHMPGLPAGLPPRPADMRPRLLPDSGTTMTVGILRFP
jgi:hypothetical protein